MDEIWFLFKILELIGGTICTLIHGMGLVKTFEPLPHNMFFCGTFFGFALYAFSGLIAICVRSGNTPIIEVITNAIGALCHFAATFLSMYYAERDLHLMYLTDMEEALHGYFFYCKAQSIASLVTGALYMLHSLLALDAVVSEDPYVIGDLDYCESDNVDPQVNAKQPLKMYFLGEEVHLWLERYRWFRNIQSREWFYFDDECGEEDIELDEDKQNKWKHHESRQYDSDHDESEEYESELDLSQQHKSEEDKEEQDQRSMGTSNKSKTTGGLGYKYV